MRALVAGGSGYFGGSLVQALRRQNVETRIFDLNPPGEGPNQPEFIQGDVRDPRAVDRALEGADVVFNCIAQVPLAKDAVLFEEVNVGGTRHILEAARKRGVAKLVHLSSSAVFGRPRENPVREDTVPTPQEPYGRAKLAAERLCESYAKEGVDITIVRPRTILGHGRLGIFQILFDWIAKGYNVPVIGKGDNRYQFVHADDLASACLMASRRKGFAVYDCGTDRFGSMREALEGLCRHAGTGSKVRGFPRPLALSGMKLSGFLRLSPLAPYHSLMYGESFYFDITKARTELGWAPRYSNSEMLNESYDWYLENRRRLEGGAPQSRHKSVVRQGILGLIHYFF